MSEEYLFKKQGSDSELEGLENLLSVYRIEPVVPKMARSQRSVTTDGRFGWFKLSFAAVIASFLIILGGVVISVRYFEPSSSEITAVRAVETPETDRSLVAQATTDRSAVDTPQTAQANRSVKATVMKRQLIKIAARQGSFVARSANTKDSRLTKEERYAYDQLMVALWITGSKLKVVKDTINRVDDQQPESANEKR